MRFQVPVTVDEATVLTVQLPGNLSSEMQIVDSSCDRKTFEKLPWNT